MQALRSRGFLLVLSSPSGGGKSSLARKLIEEEEGLVLSVSTTTRPVRPGEVHGKDYFFISNKEYNAMVHGDEFLEHAEVFGNYYGTSRQFVEKHVSRAEDIVFDVDWQGAKSLKKQMPEEVVTIHILPPSTEELRRRLSSRGQDSQEVIESRMQQAASEASHYSEYDYVVINEDFDNALDNIRSILKAERVRRIRQQKLDEFVKGMIR